MVSGLWFVVSGLWFLVSVGLNRERWQYDHCELGEPETRDEKPEI